MLTASREIEVTVLKSPEEKLYVLGVWFSALSLVLVPVFHLFVNATLGLSLYDWISSNPISSGSYVTVTAASFCLGYYFLLRSVRFLRKRFGGFRGTLIVAALLLACPFGGLLGFRLMKRK